MNVQPHLLKQGERIWSRFSIPTFNRRVYVICRNKRPGRLIFRSNKNKAIYQQPSVSCTTPLWKIIHQSPFGFMYSPLWKILNQKSSVLCTPPFEKSPIQAHRFCVLPPLKNHCFWWALISGWALISASMVFDLIHRVVNNKFPRASFFWNIHYWSGRISHPAWTLKSIMSATVMYNGLDGLQPSMGRVLFTLAIRHFYLFIYHCIQWIILISIKG